MIKKLICLLLLGIVFPSDAHAFSGSSTVLSRSVVSSAVASSLVASTSRGYLYGFSATSGATGGYVLVHDASAEPPDGAVTPDYCYQLPANQTIGISFGDYPPLFETGITIEFSTTGCFTATGSDTAYFSAQIKE